VQYIGHLIDLDLRLRAVSELNDIATLTKSASRSPDDHNGGILVLSANEGSVETLQQLETHRILLFRSVKSYGKHSVLKGFLHD
jgi:hypothetical protein